MRETNPNNHLENTVNTEHEYDWIDFMLDSVLLVGAFSFGMFLAHLVKKIQK